MNNNAQSSLARTLALVLLIAGASAGPDTAHAAQLNASYRVYLSAANNSDGSDSVDWCASGVGCVVVGSGPQASVLYDQQGQYARAVATPGLIRLRAESAWPGFTFTPFFSTVEASISDTFTLTAADDTQDTIARLRFYINGSLDYTTNGYAAMSTRVQLIGDGLFHSYLFSASNSAAGLVVNVNEWGLLGPGSSQLGDPFGLFELYVRLPIGTPIQLDWILGADASPSPPNFDEQPGTAAARLDQTAGWLGIDFLDSSYLPLDGVLLASEGGYDWSTATVVPLPGAAWLLLSALAVLLGWRRRARLALPAAVAALAVLLPAPGQSPQATTLIRAGGNAGVQWGGASDSDGADFLQQSTNPADMRVHGGAQGTVSSSGSLASAAARAEAGYGWLRVSTEIDLAAPAFDRHDGTANAGAFFIDDISIVPVDPDLLFTPGTMTVALNLDGAARLGAYDVNLAGVPAGAGVSNMGATWFLNLQLGYNCNLEKRCFQLTQGGLSVDARNNPTPDPVLVNGHYLVELAFFFGNPEDLQVNVGASMAGIAINGRGSVEGQVNLMNTLSWGGITSVVDAQGNPVDFLVQSGSGTDWAQPVIAPAVIPLPGAAWLLLSALGTLGGCRRWQRSGTAARAAAIMCPTPCRRSGRPAHEQNRHQPGGANA